MDKIDIEASEIERVNKLMKLQNELIQQYRLYKDLTENKKENWLGFVEDEIKVLEQKLFDMRVQRLCDLENKYQSNKK